MLSLPFHVSCCEVAAGESCMCYVMLNDSPAIPSAETFSSSAV